MATQQRCEGEVSEKTQPSRAAQANAVYSTGSKVLAGLQGPDIISIENRPRIEAVNSCGTIAMGGIGKDQASVPKTKTVRFWKINFCGRYRLAAAEIRLWWHKGRPSRESQMP